MRILVVGSCGFIGSHCVDYFSKAGHAVWGADIVPKSGERYFFLDPSETDYGTVFKNGNFNVCINASGSANVGFSFSNPGLDFRLNVGNVEEMLNAILQFHPGCAFINFSSAAVYGNPVSLPVKEDDQGIPLSPYGKHKLESEALLRKYSQEKGLKTCSLRVFSAYGPGLRKQLFWDLYNKARSGNLVELFGTGKETRDFIFIDDLTAAIACVLKAAPLKGECVNLASGEEQGIAQVSRFFLDAFSPGLQLAFNGQQKQGDPLHWKADIELLKSFGFSPAVKMQDGITKYVSWLKQESGLA